MPTAADARVRQAASPLPKGERPRFITAMNSPGSAFQQKHQGQRASSAGASSRGVVGNVITKKVPIRRTTFADQQQMPLHPHGAGSAPQPSHAAGLHLQLPNASFDPMEGQQEGSSHASGGAAGGAQGTTQQHRQQQHPPGNGSMSGSQVGIPGQGNRLKRGGGGGLTVGESLSPGNGGDVRSISIGNDEEHRNERHRQPQQKNSAVAGKYSPIESSPKTARERGKRNSHCTPPSPNHHLMTTVNGVDKSTREHDGQPAVRVRSRSPAKSGQQQEATASHSSSPTRLYKDSVKGSESTFDMEYRKKNTQRTQLRNSAFVVLHYIYVTILALLPWSTNALHLAVTIVCALGVFASAYLLFVTWKSNENARRWFSFGSVTVLGFLTIAAPYFVPHLHDGNDSHVGFTNSERTTSGDLSEDFRPFTVLRHFPDSSILRTFILHSLSSLTIFSELPLDSFFASIPHSIFVFAHFTIVSSSGLTFAGIWSCFPVVYFGLRKLAKLFPEALSFVLPEHILLESELVRFVSLHSPVPVVTQQPLRPAGEAAPNSGESAPQADTADNDDDADVEDNSFSFGGTLTLRNRYSGDLAEHYGCVYNSCSPHRNFVNDFGGPLHTAAPAKCKTPCIVLDSKGVILSVNREFSDACGVDGSFLVNRSFFSVLEWFDAESISEIMGVIGDVITAAAELRRQRAQRQGDLDGNCTETDINPYHPNLEPDDGSMSRPPLMSLRGYGIPDSDRGYYSPMDSQPPREQQQGNSADGNSGEPREGQFVLVVEVFSDLKEDVIVIRQPLQHLMVEVSPLPMFLLNSEGLVMVWNRRMTQLTSLSGFEMVGSDALSEFLGTLEKPLTIPAVFPFLSDARVCVGHSKTIKTLNYVMKPWEFGVTDTQQTHNALYRHSSSGNFALRTSSSRSSNADSPRKQQPILCVFENMPRHAKGHQISQHLLLTLSRIISEFNKNSMKGGGLASEYEHKQALKTFVDQTITLVSQTLSLESQQQQQAHHHGGQHGGVGGPLAFFQPQQQRRASMSSTIGSPPGTSHTVARGTGGGRRGRGRGHSMSSSSGPKISIEDGGWGRLVSQDNSICGSCMINVPADKLFRFGRSSAKCDFTIADTFVSGVQFTIARRPSANQTFSFVLVDQSANGTYVNVKKVGRGRSCVLHHNDLITFRLSTSRFFLGFVFQVTSVLAAQQKQDAKQTGASGSQQKTGSQTQSPIVKAGGVKKRPRPKTIEWKIGEELLGKGGNAEVFLGINLTNGKLIAVKRVPLPRDAASQKKYSSLVEEINVLSSAEHPNIVQYLGSSQSDTHLNILLEFVPGGSIRHLLDNFGALGEGVILAYLRQTLDGLRYLHDNGIVHADIKCGNILVTDKGEVKLTDFGTATLMTHGSTDAENITVVGTLLWMAPELVRGETGSTMKSDVWSLGCSLLEMLTSEYPWSEYDFESEEQIANLLRHAEEAPEIPQTANSLLHSITFQCLQLDPKDRPSVKDLLELLEEHEIYNPVTQRSLMKQSAYWENTGASPEFSAKVGEAVSGESFAMSAGVGGASSGSSWKLPPAMSQASSGTTPGGGTAHGSGELTTTTPLLDPATLFAEIQQAKKHVAD